MSDIRAMLVEHLPAMRKYAFRLMRDVDKGEDVLQSACVLALSSSIDPDRIENQNAWFHRCVLNAFYAQIKLANTNKRSHQKVVLNFADPALDPYLAVSGGQEAAFEVKVALTIVARLAPRDRDLVLLSAAGHTLEEIGEMMGVTKQRLSPLLQRARRTIESEMRFAA